MPDAPPEPAVGIRSTIGATPLIRLDNLLPRTDCTVWAKLEYFNPGGSAKDRTARALVDAARESGALTAGASIVESSSGNLGMALAREALLGGWNFHCVVDPRANRQAVSTMTALGATVHTVTEPDPVTGDWLSARRHRVEELLEQLPGAVCLDQYSNRAAFAAHSEGTMREILTALGHSPDLLLVATSTTGTIGGCLRQLSEADGRTTTIGVDAEGSVLFDGCRGTRTLPGFGAGVSPALAEDVHPDGVDRISDVDSVAGARLLARREGILPGASGGAVVAALLSRAPDLAPGTEVVLILHDSGGAYLETVYDDDWILRTLGVSGEELAHRFTV